ncbi:MAG: HAMP domain-containing protein [Chloroflexota bacterium]|nr:MAG: HAMP domain-containing protein [Chloroflexota bacterium]
MRKFARLSLRGLTPQLILLVVLPLAGLLLAVTFGGVALHRRAMREMVGERDRRAVQAAANTLAEQLDHRLKAVQGLALQDSNKSDAASLERVLAGYTFLQSDFDGGLAFFSPTGERLAANGDDSLWKALAPDIESVLEQASQSTEESPKKQTGLSPATFPAGHPLFLAWARNPSSSLVAVGVFSPDRMIASTFANSDEGEQSGGNLFVVDQQGQVLYQSGTILDPGLLRSHLGVTEALAGGSGATYLGRDQEHVVAYSTVPQSGWALVMEEPWESVSSPMLRLTEYAPLILLPVLAISLLAVWFGTRRIIQPLLLLQTRAARLGWGDYAAIEQPVGGISEICQLQDELAHLAHKLQAAQQGLRDYIGAMTAGQEDERRRLARELHDDTLQALIGLNQRAQLLGMRLEQASKNCEIPPLIAQDVSALQSLVESTIGNLRRLTRALRPIYLEDLGLTTALEMLAQEMSRPDLRIEFVLKGHLPRLEGQVELAVYRMAQEALSNVARHSKARRAWLSVTTNSETAQIVIRDDGQGFAVPESPAAFAPGGHFGLLGLHERAEMIGATLQIQSRPDQGTQISIGLPVSRRVTLN